MGLSWVELGSIGQSLLALKLNVVRMLSCFQVWEAFPVVTNDKKVGIEAEAEGD